MYLSRKMRKDKALKYQKLSMRYVFLHSENRKKPLRTSSLAG